jgi:glycosyltransferase involved in cell wall biosynthesis
MLREDVPMTLEDLIAEARFVINVSDFGTRQLRDDYPQFERKILRVYNGLQTSQYQVSELISEGGRAPDPPRIVGVGRLIEKKGFGDLLAACALLRERAMAFTCTIAGEGPLRRELEEQIEDYDLRDQVTLTGALPQHEIMRLLREATCFALPCVEEKSGGMDNLPTVITEAMACGLPVISTPIAGVPEQVLDGQTGILVPSSEPEVLAERLEDLLRDPAKCRALGRAGRLRAETVFDAAVTGRGLKRLLCSKGRAKAGWSAIRQDWKLLVK